MVSSTSGSLSTYIAFVLVNFFGLADSNLNDLKAVAYSERVYTSSVFAFSITCHGSSQSP